MFLFVKWSVLVGHSALYLRPYLWVFSGVWGDHGGWVDSELE